MKGAFSNIFVTVGSIEFPRLIRKMDELAPVLDVEVVMQIGKYAQYLPKHARYFHLFPSIMKYIQDADLIISHGGTGTLVDIIHAGKPLIVVPRQRRFREVIDNHQLELTEYLIQHQPIEMVKDIEQLYAKINDIANRKDKSNFDDSGQLRLLNSIRKFIHENNQ